MDGEAREREAQEPNDEARIEAALAEALGRAVSARTPPRLQSAIRHAVFPGGARLRPRLVLAMAEAIGDHTPQLALAGATAVELVHCASLVHDDMPCFDNAEIRRGRPSVHKAFGEPLALLAGDGLIVAAFEVVGRAALSDPQRGASMIAALASGAGIGSGIIAGQAWESEPEIPLRWYQQAKTGALFEAAAALGAIAAGVSPEPWRHFGALLGEAYQIADDLADCFGSASQLGKGIGRDAELSRSNQGLAFGLEGALVRLEAALSELARATPLCPGQARLRAFVTRAATRLLPADLGRRVA